jgi:hypothetical protein
MHLVQHINQNLIARGTLILLAAWKAVLMSSI